jgi:hypothetical protein
MIGLRLLRRRRGCVVGVDVEGVEYRGRSGASTTPCILEIALGDGIGSLCSSSRIKNDGSAAGSSSYVIAVVCRSGAGGADLLIPADRARRSCSTASEVLPSWRNRGRSWMRLLPCFQLAGGCSWSSWRFRMGSNGGRGGEEEVEELSRSGHSCCCCKKDTETRKLPTLAALVFGNAGGGGGDAAPNRPRQWPPLTSTASWGVLQI